jgi:hypothetical protein
VPCEWPLFFNGFRNDARSVGAIMARPQKFRRRNGTTALPAQMIAVGCQVRSSPAWPRVLLNSATENEYVQLLRLIASLVAFGGSFRGFCVRCSARYDWPV